MIDFKAVSFTYPCGSKALRDINLCVKAGEKVALIGANGAGKSTLLKAIPGLVVCDGELTVDSKRMENKNLAEIRKVTGYIFQDSDNQLFMPTVLDDMIFAPVNYGMKRDEAVSLSEKTLEELGISHLVNRRNYTLSGGEKKMAAIAVILAMNPKLILMDEPSASLDPRNRRRIINVIKEMTQTVLIATHDLDFALDTCDRVVLMHKGEIIADGRPEVLLKDRQLLEEHGLELPLGFQRMGL